MSYKCHDTSRDKFLKSTKKYITLLTVWAWIHKGVTPLKKSIIQLTVWARIHKGTTEETWLSKTITCKNIYFFPVNFNIPACIVMMIYVATHVKMSAKMCKFIRIVVTVWNTSYLELKFPQWRSNL